MNDKMKFLTTCILVPLLAAMGCRPACAHTVEVPDVAPVYEEGGPDGTPIAAARDFGDMAMLYHVPTPPVDGLESQPRAATLPLAVYASSGGETRLSLDVSGINQTAEREGWPTWLTVTAWVGGIALVGLVAWGIVEATQSDGGSSHSGDHTTIDVSGSGNTVNVNSPNIHPSATTSTSTSTSTMTGGLE